jgi:hypothetical protein
MTTYPNAMIADRELHLGDVVRVFDGPWGTAIVKRIDSNAVTFFRPYGTKCDFTCSSGVICYMGLEEFSVPMNNNPFFVYQRDELR